MRSDFEIRGMGAAIWQVRRFNENEREAVASRSTGTERILKPPQRQGLLARSRDQGADGFLPQKNDAVTIVVAAQ